MLKWANAEVEVEAKCRPLGHLVVNSSNFVAGQCHCKDPNIVEFGFVNSSNSERKMLREGFLCDNLLFFEYLRITLTYNDKSLYQC